MEQNKKLKILLMILIIVLISILSFGGIYVENKGVMKNVVPDYSLSKDLKGYRRVNIALSDETKVVSSDASGKEIDSSDTTTEVATSQEVKINKDEDLTKENFELTKRIIENRLLNMKVTNYEIKHDSANGTLVVELPEDSDTDRVVSNLYQQAKFEIVDNETNEVLMTNADVKGSVSGYTTTNSGTPVIIINIEFNKEGTEKFKKITSEYKEYEEITKDDDGIDSTVEKTKEVALKLDDTTLITTHFDAPVTNGIMQLTMSIASGSTTEDIQQQLLEANSLSTLINSGKLPLVYKVDHNKYIHSDIDVNIIKIVTVIMVALAIVGTIYLVIKYKAKGVLGGISLIGFIATLLFVIRYTNAEVSIGGLALMVSSVILNFAMIHCMLKKENVMEAIKEYALMLVPALIIAIVFTLTNLNIGAMLFWIIVITLLYNLVITKTMIK